MDVHKMIFNLTINTTVFSFKDKRDAILEEAKSLIDAQENPKWVDTSQ